MTMGRLIDKGICSARAFEPNPRAEPMSDQDSGTIFIVLTESRTK